MPAPTPEDGDLVSFLAGGRARTEGPAQSYFSVEDWGERGAYVKILIRELSILEAARSEVLRPSLGEMDDGQSHLERFDQSREELVGLLNPLNDLVRGVGSLDVHMSQPDEVLRLMTELRTAIADYNRWEAEELVPFLQQRLSSERLVELGQEASKISRLGPTHPHLDKSFDQRNPISKVVTSVLDRTRDDLDHPQEAAQGGGEKGP